MSLLEAKNLSFSYGPIQALRDVTLSLSAGQFVAMIGPNGSGKSTLIKALLGHQYGSGEITLNDRPISQWRRRDLAKVLAYHPQSPRYEPGQTVAEVLALGRAPYWGAFGLESSADQKVVSEVTDLLNLRDLLHRPMDEMSGGQRQRVFIGRCLAQQPQALLLDEPNTFLDLKNQVELCRLLRDLAHSKKLAVLMASHELNISAAGADRVILLNQGAIAAAGTPDEVLKPQVLEPVYGVSIQRVQDQNGNPVVVPTTN
jgi:iron complex transport system ATP-binding protein